MALSEGALPDGAEIFKGTCQACHQADAMGLAGAFPPLSGSAIVNDADPSLMISIVLGGYDARAEYGVMPAQAEQLTDAQIAAVVSYIRSNFNNEATAVTEDDVRTLRASVAPQTMLVP